MNPALAAVLRLLAHTAPGMRVPARPVRALASDNATMLEDLARDPLVLQEVRIDALHGLVTLMDQAMAAAEKVRVPTLVLYGANERLLPWRARSAFLRRLRPDHRAVIYPRGHHTLLRDLNAAVVLEDVERWIATYGPSVCAAQPGIVAGAIPSRAHEDRTSDTGNPSCSRPSESSRPPGTSP